MDRSRPYRCDSDMAIYLTLNLNMSTSDKIASFFTKLSSTLKSIVKLVLKSRRNKIKKSPLAIEGKPIIIMGNGPSLNTYIENDSESLQRSVTMAVNFAANSTAFSNLKPDFYLLADPHFFEGKESYPNVGKLYTNLNKHVDWPMTLFVPYEYGKKLNGISNPNITVENFNFIGVEGFEGFENMIFEAGRGMPRPRNVLIPAIMLAIRLGFKKIYLAGADHSWLKTLSVNDKNEVVSIQPHFYKDNDTENERVASVYKGVKLHEMLQSMSIALKSYHIIERFAKRHDIEIINATPGSFIDAFPREILFERS